MAPERQPTDWGIDSIDVDCFEEINRLSQEILIKTKDFVQGLGFELV